MSAVTDFHTDPTPEKAVALAIADHRAGPLTDWPYIDALRKAEEKLGKYRKAVTALKHLSQTAHKSQMSDVCAYVDRTLRDELGEEVP